MFLEHHITLRPLIYSVNRRQSVPILATFGIKNRVAGKRPIFKTCVRFARTCLASLAAVLIVATSGMSLRAQVNATVNTSSTIAVMPEYFMGVHGSVYDNSLQYTGSPVFNQLD